MSGLLETFATQASPSNLDPTVRSLGIDAPRLSQGLRLAGPLLTSGLARVASAPAGADALMRLLPTHIANETSAIETSEGQALAQLAFGASRHTVARAASQALGFDARPLLAVAAPLLLRLLQKWVTEQELDSAGLAQTLADETAAFVSQGGPQADVVKQVWASVDALEGLRRRFTERELDTVGGAPLAVTALVMGVAPSTGGNVRKELAAAARVIDGAEDLAGGAALADLLPAWGEAELKAYLGATPKTAMLSAVKNAVQVMASKAPASASAYKKFLAALGTAVAEAAKEGGFLGLGGQQVSDAERDVLAEISTALGA